MSGSPAMTALRRLFALCFCVYMLLPVAVILIASFTDASYVQFPPPAFGTRWYWAAITRPAFQSGFVFSIWVAAVVAAISGSVGVLAALAIARGPFPGREFLAGVIMAPLALPDVVLALGVLQLFAAILLQTSPWGLMAGHVLITVPFVVRLTLTSLDGLNPNYERASYTLGASWWQTLRHVTLPLVAPGFLAGVLFAFLLSFDEVTIALFTALPQRATLPAQIFAYAQEGSDPIVTAASGLMIVIAALLLIVLERFYGVLRLMAARSG